MDPRVTAWIHESVSSQVEKKVAKAIREKEQAVARAEQMELELKETVDSLEAITAEKETAIRQLLERHDGPAAHGHDLQLALSVKDDEISQLKSKLSKGERLRDHLEDRVEHWKNFAENKDEEHEAELLKANDEAQQVRLQYRREVKKRKAAEKLVAQSKMDSEGLGFASEDDFEVIGHVKPGQASGVKAEMETEG